MLTIKNTFFTELMNNNYNKYYYYLNDPYDTQFILYIFNQTNKKSKYSIMNYYIYSSNFVKKEVYNDMKLLFFYSQKSYWALQKFAIIWKDKHKNSSVTCDLMLTSLDSYKSSSLITLYEDGKAYTFHFPDLYNIIEEALTHCSHDYFLEIKKITNPYTNLPFSIGNVYNIYLGFMNSSFDYSILFKGYIQCDCKQQTFLQMYEPIIREYCIKRNFKTITNYKCVKIIKAMLKDDTILPKCIINNFKIDNSFPWKPLIYHFKPFAILYHKVKYGLNPYSKFSNKSILIKKLNLFIEENPHFGRKFIFSKITPSKPYFVFGQPTRSSYNTSVKTHFNDMTNERLKNIRYINNVRRQSLVMRNSLIQEHQLSSSESSDSDDDDISSIDDV